MSIFIDSRSRLGSTTSLLLCTSIADSRPSSSASRSCFDGGFSTEQTTQLKAQIDLARVGFDLSLLVFDLSLPVSGSWSPGQPGVSGFCSQSGVPFEVGVGDGGPGGSRPSGSMYRSGL